MARRGGYSRDQAGIEWVKTSLSAYGEAIRSAGEMHQDLYTWMNDAIAHHAYRCEQIRLQEQYQLDQREATQHNRPTVDPQSSRYRPTREKPTITRPAAGAPGMAGRHPRPAR